ncbi:Chitin synthase export chaperone [Apiospora arundinis]
MGGFGDFTSLCETAPLPLCASVGPIRAVSSGVGIEPDCYARNIELANTIIFEGASSFMHIIAMAMTIIMILHIRGKFTAVGRKEILAFFYFYMLLSFFSLIVDAGVVPPAPTHTPTSSPSRPASPPLRGRHPLSVWLLRLCSFAAFAISFLVSLATFKSWAGLGPVNTVGLFTVLYLLNAIQLVVYVVMQIMLVARTLQDRWPLGDIAFGVFFFVVGQVLLYAFSSTLCNATSHYLDGLFFATICNLLAVMMVYKYWDSITKEDLEFSVGMRMNNWEVKDLLPEEDRRTTIYMDDPSPYAQSSAYDRGYSPSNGNRMSRY